LRDNSGETFYTLALKLKFPHIRNGSVVRIRSATFDETSSKKMLVLQHYSNIMTFISSSKCAARLSKVSNDNANEKAALKSSNSMTPVVLTQVDSKHANLAPTSLHDLFHSPDNSTNTFRTCFYVCRVEPGNAADACKSYDKKTKKASKATGKGDMCYQV
jgi:NMD protein affecting ribosome stability and mRNA decay